MNRRTFVPSALAAAVGLAMAAQALPAKAQQADPKKQTMERMQKGNLEKCYGVAAKGKNDCAEGAHSCAGQATAARDPQSFVLVPAGACGKIEGGKTSAS